MTAWPLFGAGLEKLGRNDCSCVVPVPEIADDELLVRIDAIGLCFSDIKLIRAGEEHPRVISKNLATDPVIPGHEAVMTVVRVGKKREGKFRVGERYIIQADIYVKGVNYAYGYAIDGGMALYSRIDSRVLEGDEGCYLLPLADHVPSAVAALIEPWTCVIASYRIHHRSEPKKDGSVLIAFRAGETRNYEIGDGLVKAGVASITTLDAPTAFLANLRAAMPGVPVNAVATVAEGSLFDDIFLCDLDRDACETLGKRATKDGIISFIGEYPDERWKFDVGNIHYKGWFYQGNPVRNLSGAYGRNVRSKLRAGGDCWLLGGAGAMGQMHTQLAVEDAEGPARILVTDMDDTRIANVTKLLAGSVKRRGIEFHTLNPAKFSSPEAFQQELRRFAPEGFDDIVMLVPAVPVLDAAVPFLKKDGLMNIFAGIPAGKEGTLDVGAIARNGVRYIGSSGSRTSDLEHTLKLTETGKLDPSTALAAVGGMGVLKKGLEGVANATFAGKTVIFPHCPDLPLTPVAELGKLDPKIGETLRNELYTMETEKTIFERFLKDS
jgi:threonine dehydrogenase-like Zn-dependent dehydrogenase